MSEAASLMHAVLGPAYSRDEARLMLDEALCSEVDPLHWCAVHAGHHQAEIMRRAAAWLGLTYYDVVPRIAKADVAPARLEALGEVRMFRLSLLGRDVAFAAPDFFGVLRLKAAYAANPQLRTSLCLVPEPALRALLVEAAEAALIDGARQNLARSWPFAAAQLDLSRPLRWSFAIGLVLLAAAALTAPLTGEPWLLPFWLVLVVLPTLLRFCALMTPAPRPRPFAAIADADLPVYSILVPLRDEANMVDQLANSLSRLDYPPEKLQILFVVESRSPDTIAAVRRRLGDVRFALTVVPDALPRTKPKALDFALPFCHGEFVVVYDAEDLPEPGQLRRVVAQFRHDADLHCIQARLVIGNGRQGFLPALFAGEYAGLFTVLLPAFARWHAVMPLGGTSNHFRLETLRGLGGWDAYNVTEDADLGVRLARRRLRTATSTSYTVEDAPRTLKPWLGQRTRWMKGWMQTFMVHNRRPLRLLADLGLWRFALFQVTLLGMLLAPLLHTAFVLLLLWTLLNGLPPGMAFDAWLAACMAVLVLGHGTAIATNLVGLARTRQRGLVRQQLLLPVYWLLIAWATLRALAEFVRHPFRWFKTPHETRTTARSGPSPVPVSRSRRAFGD